MPRFFMGRTCASSTAAAAPGRGGAAGQVGEAAAAADPYSFFEEYGVTADINRATAARAAARLRLRDVLRQCVDADKRARQRCLDLVRECVAARARSL